MRWLGTFTILLAVSALAQTGPHRKIYNFVGPNGPIQTNSCIHGFDGTQTFTCPYSVNLGAGHRIVAICGNYSGNTMATPVFTDTQGNVYTTQGTTGSNNSINHSQSWLATAVAGSSAADTVSCNFQSGHEGNYAIGVLEYVATTVETCPTICAFANVDPATNSITNSATTTQTDLLLTYGLEPNADNSLNISSPAGFTTEINNNGSFVTLFVADKGNVGAAAQSVTVVKNPGSFPLHAGLIALH